MPRGENGVVWPELEHEYVTGTMSVRELARMHKIPEDTLVNHATRGYWEKKRKRTRHDLVIASTKKHIEHRAAQLAKFNDEDFKLACALRAEVAKHIANAQKEGKLLNPNAIRALAAAAQTAQQIGRLALGASTGNIDITEQPKGFFKIVGRDIEHEEEAFEERQRKITQLEQISPLN